MKAKANQTKHTETINYPPHAPFIAILDDQRLYSPNMVIKNGCEAGLVPEGLDDASLDRDRKRFREVLVAGMRKHQFPPQGDGHRPEYPTVKAWWGWRWKLLLPAGQYQALQRIYAHMLPKVYAQEKEHAPAVGALGGS